MACDKVPLTAPAGTVITLISATNVLPINGSTEVVAVLIENGTSGSGQGGTGGTTSSGTPVHNGTLVTFTTSLGKIEPVEARTVNGRVTVTLVADGRSGIATITAFSGSASETLEVKIGAAAAERVSVTASPSSVPADGGTVTVSARVEDVAGNPLSGVPVTFTTTAGTLSTQTVLTNESGFATTFLSTTTEATVTASSGGKSSSATVKVKARSQITVTSPAGSVFVGQSTSFTVTPAAGVAFKQVTIDFGDGESKPLGAISSPTTVVHTYADDGEFQIEVTGIDVDGGTAVASGGVSVIPFSVSVTASPTTGTTSTIFTFTVTDIPATVPIAKYVWNFGDGNAPLETNSKVATRGYQSTGFKTITVTVHPVVGDPKSATVQVLVTEDSDRY
jgi:adhesin/invasin